MGRRAVPINVHVPRGNVHTCQKPIPINVVGPGLLVVLVPQMIVLARPDPIVLPVSEQQKQSVVRPREPVRNVLLRLDLVHVILDYPVM